MAKIDENTTYWRERGISCETKFVCLVQADDYISDIIIQGILFSHSGLFWG